MEKEQAIKVIEYYQQAKQLMAEADKIVRTFTLDLHLGLHYFEDFKSICSLFCLAYTSNIVDGYNGKSRVYRANYKDLEICCVEMVKND